MAVLVLVDVSAGILFDDAFHTNASQLEAILENLALISSRTSVPVSTHQACQYLPTLLFSSSYSRYHSVDKLLSFRFPPYTPTKVKRTGLMTRRLPAKPKGLPGVASTRVLGVNKWFVLAVAVAVAVALTRGQTKLATWLNALRPILKGK